MRIYRNKSGFTAVAALLIALVLAFIGLVGYYVWHGQKHRSNSTPVTYQIIKTADGKIQLSLPSTWHVIADSNNPKADQIISVSQNTHRCHKDDPTNCSGEPCLDAKDPAPCIYEAEFQPKALDPQQDNKWLLTVEKTAMTITQATSQLRDTLAASTVLPSGHTVQKSTDKINGYDAVYVETKGGDCSDWCYTSIDYLIESNGYLVHLSNNEQFVSQSANPVSQDYSAYAPDFSKIVHSIKLNF
ncbi:MAG TPA: hypothetical protein VFH39_03465 [Candidatus Saccharimonadales bacterium]|nr:hypothetical protein [Candidatus Saccharimonadales bacterium]